MPSCLAKVDSPEPFTPFLYIKTLQRFTRAATTELNRLQQYIHLSLNLCENKIKTPPCVMQGGTKTIPSSEQRQWTTGELSVTAKRRLWHRHSEKSQSPKSWRGLCKSLSILGHPVVFDMHYKCSAATLIAKILILSIFGVWLGFCVKLKSA